MTVRVFLFPAFYTQGPVQKYKTGLGFPASVVLTLMKPYLTKGHTLYYTRIQLLEQLHSEGTSACGIVRNIERVTQNRKPRRGEM